MICVDTVTRIRLNVEQVRERIAHAAKRAGRNSDEVTLIPITKSVGIEEIAALYDLGFRRFGENRVDVARPKIEHLGNDITWHMVGRVQRRKARDVVALFTRVDSVDRLALANTLSQRAVEAGKKMEVLIEVNVSGEEAKAGFNPSGLGDALDAIRQLPGLDVRGLMTMAPFVDNAQDVRPVFRGLRELAERFRLTTMSMGMTQDFEVAVEEGATEVRIGTALFQ
jgi:PLP dependent protein